MGQHLGESDAQVFGDPAQTHPLPADLGRHGDAPVDDAPIEAAASRGRGTFRFVSLAAWHPAPSCRQVWHPSVADGKPGWRSR